jgi:hypothetical protein
MEVSSFPRQMTPPSGIRIMVTQEEIDFIADVKRNAAFLASNPEMNHIVKTEMLLRIFELVAHRIHRFAPRPGMMALWCNTRIHYLEHRQILYAYAGLLSTPPASSICEGEFPFSHPRDEIKPQPWIHPDVLYRLDRAFRVCDLRR